MTNQKLTQLTEDTALTVDDLLYLVNDPAGTPASRKSTVSNLRKGMYPYAAKSTNYTATTADFWLDVSTGGSDKTITLPAVASTPVGFRLMITKADAAAGNVIADGNASETINGVTTKTITTQFAGLMLINTGTEWRAVALSAA